MGFRDFREQLASRTSIAGLTVDAGVADALATYFALLQRWNRRINLTALPLDPPATETVDRLIVEPIAASRFLPPGHQGSRWFDLGSGGGSPAIPLRLVRADGLLVMVESKTRKAAFLREVVRELDIEASVEAMRFEDLAAASGAAATADLVTVRAVRVDDRLVDAVRTLLRADGRFALFGTLAAQLTASKCFTVESSVQLLTRTTGSHLTVLVRST